MIYAVTGGRGFVGQRLVEKLAQKQEIKKVISLDIKPLQNIEIQKNTKIEEKILDITNSELTIKLLENVDCVFHLASLVGPFFPHILYEKINVQGTENILKACKQNKIPKLVFCGSPSTRFKGPLGESIQGKSESELPYPKIYTHKYSETKAKAEKLALASNNDDFFVCSIAPHQVYGENDDLFIPNFIQKSQSGQLRVIGNGKNIISFTHVDNICHGLILGSEKLYKGSKVCGEFFVITDGKDRNFWETIDLILVGCGMKSIFEKVKVPYFIAMGLGYVCKFISGYKAKITPYSIQMITIDRYFDISKAKNLLGYKPIVDPDEGIKSTIQAFKNKIQQQNKLNIQKGLISPIIQENLWENLLWLFIIIISQFFFGGNIQKMMDNPENWGLGDIVIFGGILMISQTLLDIFFIVFEKIFYPVSKEEKRLKSLGQSYFQLDKKSEIIVKINRFLSIPYIYHFLQYTWNSTQTRWQFSELNIMNSIISIFAYFFLYDLIYCNFHKLLHRKEIYKYIHKHHHIQYIPSRGNVDGINTHPFEYICGAYLHIFSLWAFSFVSTNHIYTIVFFMFFQGFLASINHTRFDFKIPGLFAVEDHDTHHKDLNYNYGQYTMFWDWLSGTRKYQKN